ncbi:MAG: hypothetical protein ACMUIP_14220 [bacterium]
MKNKWFIIALTLVFLTVIPPGDTVSAFYFSYTASNHNFTFASTSLFDNKHYTYNYDRVRCDVDFGWGDAASFKVILDIENFCGRSYIHNEEFRSMKHQSFDVPLDPYHYFIEESDDVVRGYLYRLYSTLSLPKSSLSLGFQRIPLGIGQIWSPTDIVNPLNPLSVESQERLGVCGADYIYNMSNLAQFKAFVTLDSMWHRKDSGYRLKSNYKGWDVGISLVDSPKVRLAGLELERELFDTGMEVRSEAAYIERDMLHTSSDHYLKSMIGCAYGFKNSTYVVIEYLFNGGGVSDKDRYPHEERSIQSDMADWEQKARHYLGATIAYNITPLLVFSCSGILNINDAGFFVGPSFQWNILENTDVESGAHFYNGPDGCEFSGHKNLFYCRVPHYF